MTTQLIDAIRGDDRAVSPVIGVILMVAITVILAAVIGTFVLDIGNQVGNEQPTASFKFEFGDADSTAGNGDEYVNITHDGGDSIDQSDLKVQVGTTNWYDGGTYNGDGDLDNDWSTEVTAGSRLDVSGTINDGDEVRVIWDDPNSDKTVTIAQTEADF